MGKKKERRRTEEQEQKRRRKFHETGRVEERKCNVDRGCDARRCNVADQFCEASLFRDGVGNNDGSTADTS